MVGVEAVEATPEPPLDSPLICKNFGHKSDFLYISFEHLFWILKITVSLK